MHKVVDGMVQVSEKDYQMLMGVFQLCAYQNNLLDSCETLVRALEEYADSLPPDIIEALKNVSLSSLEVLQFTTSKLQEFKIEMGDI
jgi:hypothetical protein